MKLLRFCLVLIFLFSNSAYSASQYTLGIDYDAHSEARYDKDTDQVSSGLANEVEIHFNTKYDDVQIELKTRIDRGQYPDDLKTMTLTKPLSKEWNLSLGKDKINADGFSESYPLKLVRRHRAPLSEGKQVRLSSNLVTLQVTEDVISDGRNGFFTERQSLTGSLQLQRELVLLGVKTTPLMQYLPYDNGHSNLLVLGIKGQFNSGLETEFHYFFDERNARTTEHVRSTSLEGSYTSTKYDVRPFSKVIVSNELETEQKQYLLGASYTKDKKFEPYFAVRKQETLDFLLGVFGSL